MIKGIIFDLDGTLVTSNLDFAMMKAQLGCPRDEDLLGFIEALPSPYMREEAMSLIHQHEMQDAHQAEFLPGVKQSIDALHSKGFPMAIVTRNFAKAAKIKLARCKMPIDIILTRDDAPAKPNPAALNLVAQQWGLKNSACMYVGDYLYDIEAANNASMISCLYTPEVTPDYAQQADMIFRHWEAFLPLIEQNNLNFQHQLA
ncbi:HAD-IA family hydrolase [Pseudoalteromonas luteoviolacea]|uniref:HAD family hydrolase n=1 Tax=Pseudoalteromonas luteoviolacea TaxID=43657 RepID=UPI001B3A6389|nr:HAD-IA family hydrolase [Pseudoalteromonas luteoviolacea]MBQ4877882.1 HAD-IA family hydrolase [Pseudoalteromonas luteoviolacea]MBQ4906917.1 HAD-IA family hydrolase [Pseudoalteromonas luteoviolacea]